MLNRYIKRVGVTYRRLDRKQARNIYSKGTTVYVTLCNKGNMNRVYPIVPLQAGIQFDLAVIAYSINNGNGNTYPAFYVMEQKER